MGRSRTPGRVAGDPGGTREARTQNVGEPKVVSGLPPARRIGGGIRMAGGAPLHGGTLAPLVRDLPAGAEAAPRPAKGSLRLRRPLPLLAATYLRNRRREEGPAEWRGGARKDRLACEMELSQGRVGGEWYKTAGGRWGLALVGFAAHCFGAYFFPSVVLGVALVAANGGKKPENFEERIGSYLPVIVAWAAIFSIGMVAALKKAGWLAAPPSGAGRRWEKLAAVPVLAVTCVLGQVVLSRLQDLAGVPPEEQGELQNAGGPAFLLSAVLIAPVGEEFLFRRFLFSTLHAGGGRLAAYVVSAVLFAAIHMNLPATLLYVWMACCFAAAYERTGSVWGAAAVHALNNAAAILRWPA